MNRYTDIGEAVITSSPISGRAKIHLVQGRSFRSLAWLLLVATVLAVVTTFWLGRGKQQQPAGVIAASPGKNKSVDAHPAHQPETNALKQADQPADSAEEIKPQAALPADIASQQAASISTHQQAENALHEAQQLARHGKVNGAIESYRKTLLLEPTNDNARQAMIDLQLKARRTADAERALQLGLKYNPKHTGYSMQLARLQADRNDPTVALDTLLNALPNASSQADYQAFVASLLQRLNRHEDAVVYYRKALELQPESGEWLMSMGISLHAGKHPAEARDAFRRALDSQTLSAKSKAYVEEQLKEPKAVQPQPVANPTANSQPGINPPANSQ